MSELWKCALGMGQTLDGEGLRDSTLVGWVAYPGRVPFGLERWHRMGDRVPGKGGRLEVTGEVLWGGLVGDWLRWDCSCCRSGWVHVGVRNGEGGLLAVGFPGDRSVSQSRFADVGSKNGEGGLLRDSIPGDWPSPRRRWADVGVRNGEGGFLLGGPRGDWASPQWHVTTAATTLWPGQ
jgi:hypothetical protein